MVLLISYPSEDAGLFCQPANLAAAILNSIVGVCVQCNSELND